MTKSLLDRTRELLACRPGNLMLTTIANDCECSLQWLRLLAEPNCPHDYGIKRVQRVHDYLEQHRQRVAAL